MSTPPSAPPRKLHFVTGRLAERSLRQVVAPLAEQHGFDFTVDVLPITVAALMTASWVTRHWCLPDDATEIWVPGYLGHEAKQLQHETSIPVHIGPRDLRSLPTHFGGEQVDVELDAYSIEIIAEINHANRLDVAGIVEAAQRLANEGADIIDLGCTPGERWLDVGEAVKTLKDRQLRVSIDSFEPLEVQPAIEAGAELVLSVNQSNCDAAADWGCEVVAIPDRPDELASLDRTVDRLVKHDVPFRLDPILEPIGYGFAASLLRYIDVRQRYPDAGMMMGIGNLTELTDVDSAGLNLLLLAICEEWKIHSVLTTEVINWARTSVRECDAARRLVHYAVQQKSLPKNVSDALVSLRDPRLMQHGAETLASLAVAVRDHNYRLFAENGMLHLIAANLHLQDRDPYRLFEALSAAAPKNLDASHAFYLGFELSKAATALMLGKQYTQDQPLRWGAAVTPDEVIEYNRHRQ